MRYDEHNFGWKSQLQAKPPAWRIFLLVALIAAGVSYFSVLLGVIVAVFGLGFGFFIIWAGSSSWMKQNAYWLIAIGTLGNILLLLWKLVDFALHKK